MIDPNLIYDFIDEFSEAGNRKEVIECFTLGNCFWFAFILKARFSNETNCAIVYDDIENHFACRIGPEIYDITGNVTNQYNWENWNTFSLKDPSHTAHIVRDCIKKEKKKD